MKLLAVSVGMPVDVDYNGRTVSTGIYKTPVPQRVRVDESGLDGDGQADLEAHGGRDKAVYLYTLENYRFWQNEYKLPDPPYGRFGENLTVEGMPDDEICIGDRFRIGDAEVEVTQPRIPCFKLAMRMQQPDFAKRFLASGRVGFYVRVLNPADIGAGDPIEPVLRHPEKLSIRRSLAALVKGTEQKTVIRQALGIEALSEAWREDLGRRL